ncbi:hypothetical protein [Clostridium omnivorum]|uniref:Uncharacterized protein n=1 Tax=Clostridium omnivorum TaxID=1604902 RepID=A0ABQ5NAT1_9CLOT|nr:hypothetical protein [Clostridium sp. E14]GLC32182.1 hypothetical protein bsdE14_35920 [Clostridium sp. E14]
MKKAFLRVKRAFTKKNDNNIYDRAEGFKKELEHIIKETILSLEENLRNTKEALNDIRTM